MIAEISRNQTIFHGLLEKIYIPKGMRRFVMSVLEPVSEKFLEDLYFHRDHLAAHQAYIFEHGEDMSEVPSWKWKG